MGKSGLGGVRLALQKAAVSTEESFLCEGLDKHRGPPFLVATSTDLTPDGYRALFGYRSATLVSDSPFLPLDRHLAQNPFICDCNLKWLADFLRTNPIETTGARCASPRRLANKRIGQIKSKKFRCSGKGHLCLQWACALSVAQQT